MTRQHSVESIDRAFRHPVRILFHWALALLLGAQIIDGWLFIHDPVILGPKAEALTYHATLGVLVLLAWLGLTGFWLWERGWLHLLQLDFLPIWQRQVALIVHVALLILIPIEGLLGWLGLQMVGTAVVVFGFSLPPVTSLNSGLGSLLLAGERYLGLVIAALVGVHLAAAFYHHFILKDEVLREMLPRRRVPRT